MSSLTTCPACGSLTLAEVVAGQCPRCLFRVATQGDEEPGLIARDFDPERRQLGDYVLGKQIGAGGMGVVYEAHRLSDGRKVAIKLIREFHVASPTLLRRFTIEAEAAARLEDAHIIGIHEVGEWNGQPFISMDFVEGESLNTKIARGDFKLQPVRGEVLGGYFGRQTKIAMLMAKIARAVHHAHSRGVLHRDVKPGNIIIDEEGEPHLADFGLAKILQPGSDGTGPPSLTTSGDAPGTPSYMSPEQVSGKESGCASDIYGLGAILYAVLTGRPPFQAPTSLELFKQIMEQPPVRPSSINPVLHRDLEKICLKCLEKDPRHRYSTGEALAEDLERFAAGQAIVARAVTPLQRTWRWVQRNRIAAALIASLCLGLIATTVLLKLVNDIRLQLILDRDEAFEEGMRKISLVWSDPATKSVTISPRELAILSGRSAVGLSRARYQLRLGVRAKDRPTAMAQGYAHFLGRLQQSMERDLGAKVAFNLQVFKRSNPDAETLARGEVDFMSLDVVDFLEARKMAARVMALAQANTNRAGVIFTRADSGIRSLSELRGKAIGFPGPRLPLALWAKAELFRAGLKAQDLRMLKDTIDDESEDAHKANKVADMVGRILRRELDAGVISATQFQHYQHLGLVALDRFQEPATVLAAREGLEPKLVGALRNALGSSQNSQTPPEHRFIAVQGDSEERLMLNSLRSALDYAKSFDERVGR